MFYQCPKCKNTWQYFLPKCPHCFLELKRIESKKAKVISVSKVNIPSIFHLKVPYFVLLLEDENKNKWPQKSERGYKIGENLNYETKKDKNAVSIWKIKYDILEGIERTIEFLGGIELGSNSKVLILPTLKKATHSFFAENTSIEFLNATIEYLIKRKVKRENIKVCGQVFDESEIEVLAKKSGFLKICQKFKICLFDLSKGEFIEKNVGKFRFFVSKEVFESDLILNLPILKKNEASATENIFKFLKRENYLALSYLYSKKEIFENLKKVLPEILTIGDANFVQDENGIVRYFNLIFCSFNTQNLDRVFLEISNFSKLPEILKNVKLNEIEILGRKIEEIKIYP